MDLKKTARISINMASILVDLGILEFSFRFQTLHGNLITKTVRCNLESVKKIVTKLICYHEF